LTPDLQTNDGHQSYISPSARQLMDFCQENYLLYSAEMLMIDLDPVLEAT
jgi:hypothetical protein